VVDPELALGAEELPIVVWDSMGYRDDAYKNGELGFILDGHLPNRFPLNPEVRAGFLLAEFHNSLLR
jgi:hypothetical protein